LRGPKKNQVNTQRLGRGLLGGEGSRCSCTEIKALSAAHFAVVVVVTAALLASLIHRASSAAAAQLASTATEARLLRRFVVFAERLLLGKPQIANRESSFFFTSSHGRRHRRAHKLRIK